MSVSRSRMTAVWAVTLCLLVGMGLLLYSMQPGPHEFPRCLDCHLTAPDGTSTDRRLVQSVTAICGRCHQAILDHYSHPVDVRPSTVSVPADLPLSPKGEITCSTCHAVHGPRFDAEGLSTRFLRRRESRADFCRICHPGFRGDQGGHAETLAEPHALSKYVVTDPSQGIDALSKNCIGCHDGSFSASVTVTTGVWVHGRDFLRHDKGSHPIGIDYESARLKRGRKTDLRPRSQVDPRIRFFGGKVGCGSCHDPYSTIEKRLVMSDRGSELCFSCHMIDS